MWFQILQSKNKDDIDNPLWVQFPPEIRYNMDQVNIPFVVNHDRTFTTHDNNDIHISAPSDDLRKRKFTVYVVFNTVSGDKRQGFVDIDCKGTGKRISKKEQDIWYARSKIFF